MQYSESQTLLFLLSSGCDKVDQKGEDKGWARPGSYSQRNWDHVLSVPSAHHHHLWRYTIQNVAFGFIFIVGLSELTRSRPCKVKRDTWKETTLNQPVWRFRVWSRKSLALTSCHTPTALHQNVQGLVSLTPDGHRSVFVHLSAC